MKAMPRHGCARPQSEALDQFEASHSLQHGQHGLLVNRTRSDLCVAALARFEIKFETRSLLPELFIVEGRKPLLDLLHVGKRVHCGIVLDRGRKMQIAGSR